MFGLWPYVVAVVDTHACEIVCAYCASKRYDSATFAALVDGDDSATPDSLGVILGGSEDLLDLDAPRYMSRYGETIPARKCDACGEDLTETAPPDELPF